LLITTACIRKADASSRGIAPSTPALRTPRIEGEGPIEAIEGFRKALQYDEAIPFASAKPGRSSVKSKGLLITVLASSKRPMLSSIAPCRTIPWRCSIEGQGLIVAPDGFRKATQCGEAVCPCRLHSEASSPAILAGLINSSV